MNTYPRFSRGLLLLRLEDTNIEIRPVFILFIASIPDLQGQRDTIEDMRPLSSQFWLLEVDERGDHLLLRAVEVLVMKELHQGLGHGVTGAGGDGALAGRCRCGPGRTFGYLVWKRSHTYSWTTTEANRFSPGISVSCLDPKFSMDCSELFSTSKNQLLVKKFYLV